MSPGGTPGGAAAPSLDKATLTVLARPTCGEATSRVSSRPEFRTQYHASGAALRKKVGRGVRGKAADPERAAQEADRRARARVRRWCLHRRANRLGTLTYRDPEFSWDQVWSDLEEFRRELVSAGVPSASVLLMPEPHPGPMKDGVQVGDSHGWHVHIAVAQFIPVDVLRSCWERATPNAGFVDIRKIRVRGGTGAAGARVNARYIAKTLGGYISKQVHCSMGADDGGGEATQWRSAPVRPFDGKRFSLAKGQQVPEVRFTVIDPAEGWLAIREACGFALIPVWSSPDDWGKGPPITLWEG